MMRALLAAIAVVAIIIGLTRYAEHAEEVGQRGTSTDAKAWADARTIDRVYLGNGSWLRVVTLTDGTRCALVHMNGISCDWKTP